MARKTRARRDPNRSGAAHWPADADAHTAIFAQAADELLTQGG
jgi:hypothetical protein